MRPVLISHITRTLCVCRVASGWCCACIALCVRGCSVGSVTHTRSFVLMLPSLAVPPPCVSPCALLASYTLRPTHCHHIVCTYSVLCECVSLCVVVVWCLCVCVCVCVCVWWCLCVCVPFLQVVMGCEKMVDASVSYTDAARFFTTSIKELSEHFKENLTIQVHGTQSLLRPSCRGGC